jgi:hypothetical protein
MNILKRRYLLRFMLITVLFFLNAVFLYFDRKYDTTFHNAPEYSTYLSFRSLLLQPRTIGMFVLAFLIWYGLVYWKNRGWPMEHPQMLNVFSITLGTLYGLVLLVFFKL